MFCEVFECGACEEVGLVVGLVGGVYDQRGVDGFVVGVSVFDL